MEPEKILQPVDTRQEVVSVPDCRNAEAEPTMMTDTLFRYCQHISILRFSI
jgi:hypothetical protein